MIAELLRLAQQTGNPNVLNSMLDSRPEKRRDSPSSAEKRHHKARKKKNKLSKLSRRKNR